MSNPIVSFEGGPILVGPSSSLKEWRGIEGADYESLCSLFDADQSLKVIGVPAHEADCIAVDFGGPGTVQVISNKGSLILIRAWHVNPDSNAVYAEALSAAEPSTAITGEVNIASNTVAIAWAAESLEGISLNVLQPMVPSINLAVDGSVLLHPLEKGRYRWCRSEISLPSGSIVRLVFDPV